MVHEGRNTPCCLVPTALSPPAALPDPTRPDPASTSVLTRPDTSDCGTGQSSAAGAAMAAGEP